MEYINEARIYVGTYAKYNDGSLFGEWIDLSNFNDINEFYDYCNELHNDEQDPELMFQDWEYIPDSLIGESWLSENFFEIRDAIDNLTEIQRQAFSVWVNNGSYDIAREDTQDLINHFEEEYCGQYRDEDEYAYEIVEEYYDLPVFAKTYFDYEKFAQDLFISDYWFDDGFVFRYT